MNKMRKISLSNPDRLHSDAWLRALRALTLSVAVTSVALTSAALTSSTALAADDDETPEPSVIGKLMKGIGAVSPTDQGIDYRERSPLVVPPSLDLPPPETRRSAVPNWPKDPDVAERKARIEASKNIYRSDEHRSLSPSELEAGGGAKAKIRATTATVQPGMPADTSPRALSPSELGSKNLFSKLLNKKSEETATFTAEPSRDDLTQPPSGYQTPSPSYAYGLTKETKAAEPPNTLVLSPSQMR